jgi:hypothetical protein
LKGGHNDPPLSIRSIRKLNRLRFLLRALLAGLLLRALRDCFLNGAVNNLRCRALCTAFLTAFSTAFSAFFLAFFFTMNCSDLRFSAWHCECRAGEQTEAILFLTGGSRCRVSFTDPEVSCMASMSMPSACTRPLPVAQLREDDVSPLSAGEMTEFTVAVYKNPTEHKIRLGQVLKRAEHTKRQGPEGITKRNRVRALLNT